VARREISPEIKEAIYEVTNQGQVMLKEIRTAFGKPAAIKTAVIMITPDAPRLILEGDVCKFDGKGKIVSNEGFSSLAEDPKPRIRNIIR
jgi:hypothetical protein